MRVFRTSDAALAAGFRYYSYAGFGHGAYVGIHGTEVGVLSTRERRMLETLEANVAAFEEAERIAAFWSDALLARQQLDRTRVFIKELAVEG